MAWGLAVGMAIVALLFVFIAYILFKETRTHRFWQTRVEEGDLEMISQLVRVEVERWRMDRPPKGMSASVWGGIQGVELVDLGRDYLRASSTAEPRFAIVGGARRQVTSALDEGKRITAKLAERFFYDVPHVRLERVQIDCYTTFHAPGGEVDQRCILSTLARRADAAEIDWENDPPEAIAEQLGARYQLDGQGVALPFEPDEEAVRAGADDAAADGPASVS